MLSPASRLDCRDDAAEEEAEEEEEEEECGGRGGAAPAAGEAEAEAEADCLRTYFLAEAEVEAAAASEEVFLELGWEMGVDVATGAGDLERTGAAANFHFFFAGGKSSRMLRDCSMIIVGVF